MLAARAIAAIENPADICVIAARPVAQRALLKFAAHTGSTPICNPLLFLCINNLNLKILKFVKAQGIIIISQSWVYSQVLLTIL